MFERDNVKKRTEEYEGNKGKRVLRLAIPRRTSYRSFIRWLFVLDKVLPVCLRDTCYLPLRLDSSSSSLFCIRCTFHATLCFILSFTPISRSEHLEMGSDINVTITDRQSPNFVAIFGPFPHVHILKNLL